MGLALGQTPSMRNRQGQHIMHELYCGSRHHPEGMDDRLTLISIGGLQHSFRRQLRSRDERLDACHHGAHQILADPSTTDSVEIIQRTAPMAQGCNLLLATLSQHP